MLAPDPSRRLSAGECLSSSILIPSLHGSAVDAAAHEMVSAPSAVTPTAATTIAATTVGATATVDDDQRPQDDVERNDEECPEPVRSELAQSESVQSESAPHEPVPCKAKCPEPANSELMKSEPVKSRLVQSEPPPPEPVPYESAPSELIPLEPAPTALGEMRSDSHGVSTTIACEAVDTAEESAVNPAFDVQQKHEVKYLSPELWEKGGAGWTIVHTIDVDLSLDKNQENTSRHLGFYLYTGKLHT